MSVPTDDFLEELAFDFRRDIDGRPVAIALRVEEINGDRATISVVATDASGDVIIRIAHAEVETGGVLIVYEVDQGLSITMKWECE